MLENIFNVLAATLAIAVFTFFVGCIPLYRKFDPILLLIASIVSIAFLVSETVVIAIPEAIVAEFGKNDEYRKVAQILPIAGYILINLLDNLESIPYIGKVFKKSNEPKYGGPYGQTQLRTSVILKSIILSTATLGLVVHAIADGMSLGTCFVGMDSFQPKLYCKLLAHKIPTSVSLVGILIKENYSYNIIPFHLGFISLATSIASFAAYLAFSIESMDPLAVKGLLLFSRGILFHFFINALYDINAEKIFGNKSKQKGQRSEFAIKEEKVEMEEKLWSKTSVQRDKVIASLFILSTTAILTIVQNR